MGSKPQVLVSRSAGETGAIGRWLGERLWAGAFVALTGDLGAGKTVLAAGILAGLGIQRTGGSPTFPLLWEYPGGRLPAYHWDVYRVERPEELDELGYADSFFGEGVCLVEWADRVRGLWPAERLEIHLEPAASGVRPDQGNAVGGTGAAVAAGSTDQGALASFGGGGVTAGVGPAGGPASLRKLRLSAVGARYVALLEELIHAGPGV